MLSDLSGLMAKTRLGIRPFPLGKTKIDKNTALCTWVVQEIGRLDVSVENLVIMNTFQGGEELSKVNRDLCNS